MPPKNLEATEAKYTATLNGLYEKLLDLNASMSEVSKHCGQFMNLREELLTGYGVVTAPPFLAKAPAGKGPRAPKASTIAGNEKLAGHYRMKLLELLVKRAGKLTPDKDDLVFETTQPDEETKQWTSTVSSPLMTKSYTGLETQAFRRAAEQSAAAAAMKEEFPEAYAEMQSLGDVVRGQKRKLEDDPVFNDKKGELFHGITLLLDRTLIKDDIIFTAAGEAGSFVATVSIPNYKGKPANKFTGATAATKKQAEFNAAEVAVSKLASLIKPAMQKHKEKKIAKHAEAMAALEVKRAAEGK